ncbi:zinc finger protein 594-like [Penaeus monodon]|uniref:zinc finger protein 594-like n=1 Tax=Penaeus monodon TaxID=6687 RepID=UPI0018A7AD23|nr:zinc finger protein 594-like [Penaeus monodon]
MPYSCDICNKAFSSKSSQVNHMRVHTQEKPYNYFLSTCTVIMSFLGDALPSAPLTGKEIVGTGVSFIEELIEDVTEDTCLEIKEELLDYGDEARNDLCNMNIIHESHFFHNLPDLRHEAHAKDLCNLVQDCNDMSKVSFGAKDCGKTCSSDGVQVCGKELSKESHIRIHMRVHTKEKPYNFDICNKTFPSKSDLERHESCEICNNAFSCNLVAHIRGHTKEKPYCCENCNKAFSYKGSLEIHMRRHRKEKTYSCEICNKAFYLKSHVIPVISLGSLHFRAMEIKICNTLLFVSVFISDTTFVSYCTNKATITVLIMSNIITPSYARYCCGAVSRLVQPKGIDFTAAFHGECFSLPAMSPKTKAAVSPPPILPRLLPHDVCPQYLCLFLPWET